MDSNETTLLDQTRATAIMPTPTRARATPGIRVVSSLKLTCRHKLLAVKTERDRCTWIKCAVCNINGPKKHSVTLALCAWIVFIANDHPKRRERNKPPTRAMIRSVTLRTK